MPSVPMEIPSLTPIVLKRNPVNPASLTPGCYKRNFDDIRLLTKSSAVRKRALPVLTSADRSMRCMLQGLPSNQTEQIPTWGRAIVSGVRPVAYNIAWEAPWLGGSVIIREYLFKISFSASACKVVALLMLEVDCLFRLKENTLLQQTTPTRSVDRDGLIFSQILAARLTDRVASVGVVAFVVSLVE